MRRTLVGGHVVYHDPRGEPHDALLTTVWSDDEFPLVNLVLVSSDDTRQDAYGRQIERQTSCNHASKMNVHGNYWRFPDETPNAYTPPSQV
jgi:hypothetical protein